MENKIGYIRKTEKSNICYYSYVDLYTDYALRIRLRNDIESHRCTLSCACCDSSPVTIGTAEKGFPVILSKDHDNNCLEYLKELKDFITSSIVGLFLSKGGCLPVDFKIYPKPSTTCQFINDYSYKVLTISSLPLITNMIVAGRYAMKNTPLPDFNTFLSDWKAYLGMYSIRKSSKDYIHFIKNAYADGKEDKTFRFTRDYFFKKWQRNGLFYYIGRIKKEYKNPNSDNNSKKYTYIICQDENTKYDVFLRIATDKLALMDVNFDDGIYGVAGFVVCKEVKVDAAMKTKHTKINPMSNVSKSSYHTIKKEVSELMAYSIFYMNEAGMICFNKDELNKTNEMLKDNIPVYKPYAPVPESRIIPPLSRC